MKPRNLFVVLVCAVLLAPSSVAVPDEVGGISALVESTGTEQDVRVYFPIAADDPGTYTYNVTIDATGPVEFPDVESSGAVRADGFITWTVTFAGATDAYDFFVHAWDGVDEGPASCTVNVDTANLGDYDSCGTLDPTYIQHHCLDATQETLGFSAINRVVKVVGTDTLQFSATDDEAAWGGVNLGGDSLEYRYDAEFRAQTDGSVSKILFFYSGVDLEASASSVGDAATAIKSTFTVPRTGAFATGVGVAFEETGSNYNAKLFYNEAGTTTVLLEEEWSDGVTANQLTLGTVQFSEYLGVFNVTLGNEQAAFSTSLIPNFTAFHSFWITEFGGRSIFNTVSQHDTEGDSSCLNTLDADLGGAVAEPGAPSEVQAFESFDGQGGALNAPTFPFIDMEAMAESLEISVEALGYVMVGVSLFVLATLGFLAGGRTGLLVGAMLVLPFTVQLGDLPRWLAALVFLGMMSYGVLKKGKSQRGLMDA